MWTSRIIQTLKKVHFPSTSMVDANKKRLYNKVYLQLYLLNCIGQPLGNINLFSSPQARIGEAEECIDGLNSKAATTEKLRSRYQLDLDELQNESERISSRVTIATKKLQTFDKVRSVLVF